MEREQLDVLAMQEIKCRPDQFPYAQFEAAGYEVAVYNRTKSKADAVVAEGALWCDSAAQCAAGRDAVITIVGYPKDVEEVYFGEGGVRQRKRWHGNTRCGNE